MDISILFPTYNGESTISYTLDSFVTMNTQGLDWELLICINNSTDNSLEIIEQYKDKLPLKIFNQPIQGKSACMNLLLEHALGNLLIMTDDDVIAPSNWVTNYIEIAERKSSYDIFGGKIVAHCLEHPPFWFEAFRYKHIAFALTPDKFTNQEVGPGSIFGPSMAIRRQTLQTGVKFNNEIGPNGGNYEMGCETDFLTKLSDNNLKSWISDQAKLKHIIRPFQFKLTWLEKRAYRYGLSMYYKDLSNNFDGARSVLGIPIWRINLFAHCWLKTHIGSNKNPEYANYIWEVGFFKGYLRKRLNG